MTIVPGNIAFYNSVICFCNGLDHCVCRNFSVEVCTHCERSNTTIICCNTSATGHDESCNSSTNEKESFFHDKSTFLFFVFLFFICIPIQHHLCRRITNIRIVTLTCFLLQFTSVFLVCQVRKSKIYVFFCFFYCFFLYDR